MLPWRKCETGPSAMFPIISVTGIAPVPSIMARTNIRTIILQAGLISAICPKDLSAVAFIILLSAVGRRIA